MDTNDIWQKIARQMAEEASPEEQSAVDEWSNETAQNKRIHTILSKIWAYNPSQLIDTSSIYKRFLQRRSFYTTEHQISNRFLYYALRISAVLFLLVTTTYLLNEFVLKENSGKTAYHEIYIPKGNRTSFVLSDGTKIWLSNNSTLRYPTAFSRKAREIELVGEAYFEVTHDEKRPFIVNIGQNRIKVLGTQFSVTAYPDDNIVRAELLSGKILFQIQAESGQNNYNSYEVKPSHSLTLDKSTGRLVESEISKGFFNYWQKGVYEFSNESLESLAKKINRIYNVELVFEDENIKKRRFSGTIDINDNIYTFLEAIKRTSIVPFEYRYEEGKIYVKLKK